MTDIKINIDATFATELKVGDTIQAGQQLGIKPDCDQPVISQAAGQIKEIIFDPDLHQFQIIISR